MITRWLPINILLIDVIDHWLVIVWDLTAINS